MLRISIILIALINVSSANSQQKWINKGMFNQKNFIENKGQFDNYNVPEKEKLLFLAHIDDVEYCFTKTGYTIIKKDLTEKESLSHEFKNKLGIAGNEEEIEKEFPKKFTEHYHQFRFDKCSPDVILIASERVNNYYSYSDVNSPEKKGTIIANAFRKLTYKNIYPYIDVTFEFPGDSTGIKYSVYLHPGADASQIKFAFPLASRIKTTGNNIEIFSQIGKITDHSPFTFFAGTRSIIKSKFKLENNSIGFKLNVTNKIEQTVVIDPWTTTPSFAGSNDAYDIDYDNAGNVYIYGGATGGPFVLLKYSASGSLIWTYTPSIFTQNGYYGDFAVDRNSNNIYLVEGFNGSGSQVVKINNNALQLASYPGDPQFIEMWRISFSRCSNQAVIAGGGVSSPTYQTCFLDTNLTNLTNVQYIPTTNCCHDVNMLALDNYGNCYQITNKSSVSDSLFENTLVKLPLPNLLPLTYAVQTGYAFNEAGSNTFYGGFSGFSNGYNGLTTSSTNLYSYDSYVLKKWDGPTGALLTSKRINYPISGDSSMIYWGGLSADDCGNLFVADSNTVLQFDNSLNLINSYVMPGVITDVNLSSNGVLYVCGLGYASTFFPTGLMNCSSGGSLSLSASGVNATCTTPGSATATITGGSPPYSIVWNTTPPQYSQTISNLAPGTYIVSVNEGSCLQQSLVDTVIITATSGAFSSNTLITPGCSGSSSNGTITVTASGGILPYTYNWSTGTTDSTNTISGLAPGTYSLTITDSAGCVNIYPSLIIPPPMNVNYSFTGTIKCFNDTTSLSIVLSGGSPPYTVNWTNPTATGTTLHGIAAGNFTGYITDAGGCTQPFNYTLSQPPYFNATSTSSFNCAVPNSGVISIAASGGNSPYTYSWTTFPANTTNTNSSLPPGIYNVTVMDSNLCTVTLTDTIESYSPLIINGTVTNSCFGGSNGSIVVTVSGGTGSAYQYSWSGIPTNTSNSLNNAAPGSYTVNVANNSCNASSNFTILQNAAIDTLNLETSYCHGEKTATLMVGKINPQSPIQWYNSGTAIPNATASNYTAPVNLINNYNVTWYYGGCEFTTSGIDSTVFPHLTATTPTNVFSPNNDATNDLFFPFVELTNSSGINYFVEYHLQIFDRWGNKVYESNSSEKGWNGITSKNKKADAGVYFWIVNGESSCDNKEFENKGYVHLFR